MDYETLLQMLGVSTVEEGVARLTALNATITDLRAATGASNDSGVVRAVNLATFSSRQLEQLTGKTGADAVTQVSAWKAEAEALPAAKADAEVAKTELENAKKKAKKKNEFGEDEDEDEEDEEMNAKNAAIAEAMQITNCKDIAKLSGALVALGEQMRGSRVKDVHAARVERLFKDGKIPPHIKKKAVNWTPAQLDGFIEMTGGEKFAPVNEEHEPNDEAPEVKAAREAQKPPAFDPAKVELDETELKMCSVRDPHGTDGFKAKYLADKVSRAEAEFKAKNGR